jgi:hypothetical protein
MSLGKGFLWGFPGHPSICLTIRFLLLLQKDLFLPSQGLGFILRPGFDEVRTPAHNLNPSIDRLWTGVCYSWMKPGTGNRVGNQCIINPDFPGPDPVMK